MDTAYRAIAIVGVGAILPDAPNARAFWENVKGGRYSISEVSPERWDPALYYDPDPAAPDKTYSKIGGWVREYPWDPAGWRLPIPPRVAAGMDGGQKWGIACTREALEDYGYPARAFDPERTAVILGNAMAGEKHYLTSMRIFFPEYARELAETETFAALPPAMRREMHRQWCDRIGRHLPEITEDTMPGELSNCIAGRIANLFNFRGPNYVVDAACASAMAAISSAAEGLMENDFDVAITGGIDRNMGPTGFIKFSKIGALSATGSRPFDEGADGFVMGEGAAVFIMKRLVDAERDGDRIYAVLRAIAGSSDGKGKGITAPNPVGQKLAIQRAWRNAGVSPATAGMMEAHGTSTRVGDRVEAECLVESLRASGAPERSVALGSVKSNFGHLKAAAGAAGLLKTTLALSDKLLPPSLNFDRPNPEIDFTHSPVYVNTELKPWPAGPDGARRAGLSAFGFGGSNFHAVLEEYIPHRLTGNGKTSVSVSREWGGTSAPQPGFAPAPDRSSAAGPKPRSTAGGRGALLIGAPTESALAARLRDVQSAAETGRAPAPGAPSEADLRAPERLAIDYAGPAELADRCGKAIKALAANQPAAWKALRAQGVFRGHGPAPKVAFLYTGQGSQYVNMLRDLREAEPVIAEAFAEADRALTPVLGKPLTEYVFVDRNDPDALARGEEDLRQTAITQPAVLAADIGLTRLLASYGIRPDMTMGHSLGEYGALVAAGGMPFEDALEAVCARGREMTRFSAADNGRMAAVAAPLAEIERILKTVDGYVVVANINSEHQAVIGGASRAVEQAMDLFRDAGYDVIPLSVSHAFHTSIVAPASEPLRQVLERLRLQPPSIPTVSNVDGEFYRDGPDAKARMLDTLARQVASPVQFVKGLRTLYDAGARVFVEVGPKKALQGFAEDVLGERGDVLTLFTNHPKVGDITAFNQALCGLYAAGLGSAESRVGRAIRQPSESREAGAGSFPRPPGDTAALTGAAPVITGASLGLPGVEHVFDDANIARMLRGDQFIDVIPSRFRRRMVEKRITRLVKSENNEATFEAITSPAEVIKLAGRAGAFDPEQEFGIPAERLPALDRTSQLAIAAGIDAMRDAGIPLVMRYKTATTGKRLPDRWMLPEELRDDTGVIFASAFPGLDSFAAELSRFYADQGRREQIAILEDLRARAPQNDGRPLVEEIDRRMESLRAAVEKEPFVFDRRFIFRVLPMGHSQFAEFIGARGPNTQVNAACASTTHAVSVAEDWIRAGRCRRVIIISADDVTSENLLDWMGACFLATGAAAIDDVVEEAALPFDRRRHGMILGMGAAALVVENADAARERGLRPICEVLSAVTANSAFHGTRLDVEHITRVMEDVVSQAEARSGIPRRRMAESMIFISHETYTPARGGSASAEIHALRRAFGDAADKIVISNTKGFTGHAMATGIEDVIAVKALETGCAPPVANFKEVDPELGPLNLSRGGACPAEFSLRLGAGFGSQISMALYRWTPGKEGVRQRPDSLGYQYRVVDPDAWTGWLGRMAGAPTAELETVQRTLRIRDGRAGVGVNGSSAQPAARQAAPPVPPRKEVQPERTAATPAPPPAVDPVQERILALVAEKTGYPREMLALDLDLEADLGVDTVKQAEVFAAVREIYQIPRETNLKLRDFPTVAHVIRFVQERVGPVSQPAAASAPPPAAEPAAPQPAPEVSGVREKVLAIVAEKTGYPREMLDLDLDLEADLGIDTVKQAEMFASVRAAFDIPREGNLKLRDFPTLAHVIRFAEERGQVGPASEPAAAASTLPPPRETAAPQPAPEVSGVREKVLAIVAEKTGYPREMLDLDLDLEADLGIDTVKQAEMFASVRAAFDIPREANLKLRDFPTLAHVIRFAEERRPAPAGPASEPVAAAPTPPQPRETAAPQPAPEVSGVREKVLAIVAEKTGYPREMLDLDLDLEADLGIDTVKQAEMFASVRAAFDIPREASLKLRDFPTLAHVIRFAEERGAGAAASSAGTKPGAERAPEGAAVGDSTMSRSPRTFEAAAQVPRRVPVPRLRPALGLCKPTGVTLGPGSRVIVMPDQGGVAAALSERLAAAGVTVVQDPAPNERIDGVYWLPALDDEGSLAAMELADWRAALDLRVKSLYSLMRGLFEQNAFLVSATRLGGRHGYEDAGASAPLGGAVTGFTKAYKRERPDALVKAVDFEPGRAAAEIADILIQETQRGSGAVEIGYQGAQRCSITLEARPVEDGQPGLALDSSTVFVVTGAAGSIVSAITADLASASGGTFYLLDVVPEPDPANPELQKFATDREGLKRDIFARIQACGLRATPALVEKELAALERAQAAQSAIDAVRAAGGNAQYFSVNLTDPEAVAQAMDEVRRRSGRVDVLLHAAGVERSHFLPDKDRREFDLVFDVKSDGWFNLLRAIGDMPLGATVAFSSVAGRFGNAGQTDYSAANDLLCKIASSFRATRPATRAIVIDWTAWGGIGMATRGSIPKMMELAGIEMLPPDAGIPWIRRELTAGGARGEVVVARALGVLMNEWDPAGGLDPLAAAAPGPMVGRLAGMGIHGPLTVETQLDPAVQPFLHDHQIEGTPVLPGVMGVEAFAEAALAVFPGWRIDAVEDVSFQSPFKFYRREPRAVRVEAVFHPEGEDAVAVCRLMGSRTLANQEAPQITTHFTGRVRLTRRPLEPAAGLPPRAGGPSVTAEDIYRVYFHGPAYRVLARAWIDGSRIVGEMAANLPGNHHPPEQPLALEPRLLELCFQTVGLWELSMQSRMGLPHHAARVSPGRRLDLIEGTLYAVVTPHPEDQSFDADVVDAAGNRYLQLSGYRTVALAEGVNAEPLIGLRRQGGEDKELSATAD